MSEEGLRVLIVDDQKAVVGALSLLFELNDIPYLAAGSPEEALAVAASEPLGAVVQDMNFAPGETDGRMGAELFRAIRDRQSDLPVLLITAWASLETAVELVRDGAADYIQKPWDDAKLIAAVKNLVRLRSLEIENDRLRKEIRLSRAELAERYDLGGIIYASESMHRLLSLATSVSDSDVPVLITGASGCGKERVAEIVQANSPRRDRPFIRVNVGAIPEELIESELFGAEAGAYTGSTSRRLGYFAAADGGTLFLDEIDSLSLSGQVKLLRVLQSGEVQRLGSTATRRVDVRVLAATNAHLQEALKEGRFREDLFFRLNVVEIAVPPLEQRPEDILPLARHFLAKFAREDGRSEEPVPELSAEAEGALLRHPWTGNVRELENRIRRAALVAQGPILSPGDLGLGGDEHPSAGTGAGSESGVGLTADAETERRRIVDALEAADGVVARASERLGLSRQALYRKMSRLGIELERRPKPRGV